MSDDTATQPNTTEAVDTAAPVDATEIGEQAAAEAEAETAEAAEADEADDDE